MRKFNVSAERWYYRTLNFVEQRRYWQRVVNPNPRHRPRFLAMRIATIKLRKYYLPEIRAWVVGRSPVVLPVERS